jgi:hypothetical protein
MPARRPSPSPAPQVRVGLTQTDGLTFVLVPVLFSVVAALACLLPAWRVTGEPGGCVAGGVGASPRRSHKGLMSTVSD